MPYIQIVLTELSVTKDQERELTAGAIEVIAGGQRKNSHGIMVSIEEVCGIAKRPQEGRPGAVTVRVHVSPQTISAQDRAKITWATIGMLKGILGNHPDMTYQVAIEEAATDIVAFPFTVNGAENNRQALNNAFGIECSRDPTAKSIFAWNPGQNGNEQHRQEGRQGDKS